MMVNMGAAKKLVACFDISTRAGRSEAVGSIFGMLAEILQEEESLLEEMECQQAGACFKDSLRHTVSQLICAMDSLGSAFAGDSRGRLSKAAVNDDSIPF